MSPRWSAAALMVAVVAVPQVAGRQEASSRAPVLRGCVTDFNGGALPGATITARSRNGSAATTTRKTGCYEFDALQPGTYDVTVTMAGFESRTRSGVRLTGTSVIVVDFEACVGQLEDPHYILPSGGDSIEAAFAASAAVAHVRVREIRAVDVDCRRGARDYSADVLEWFKAPATTLTARVVAFEVWPARSDPPAPVAGQELVVFLAGEREPFHRTSGPNFDFILMPDGRVINHRSQVRTKGLLRDAFLAELRRLRGR